MAETLPQTFGRQVYGFTTLPLQKQAGFLAGVAVIVAVVVLLATWALQPTYQPLLPGMSERDKAQAVAVLARSGIPHRLESSTGLLTVPAAQVHSVRLQLATEGLPRNDGLGFELLDQENGIGTSRMMENTRYQRALEGELARSVTTLNSVDSARVHLALPRQTVFVRDRVRPSASVLVNLHPGRNLDEAQIAGIVHLVASSVAELEPERVTVVDQRGRLLSQPDDALGAALPTRQLDYTRKLEESIRQRVQDILAPVIGEDGLRVQVTAAVDFTQIESTRESFDGDNAAVRSEQLAEEVSRTGLLGGIPGALSNQPPGDVQFIAAGTGVANQPMPALAAGGAPAPAPGTAVPAGAGTDAGSAVTAPVETPPANRNVRSTRNYEIDRTIEHVRQAPANLSRLSVAVVVDDREVVGEGGLRTRVAREPAELDYLTGLVREAIGFDESRGDRVTLVNASFREHEALPDPDPQPVWEQAWFQDLVRQGLGALGVLILIFAVLRPAFLKLAQAPRAVPRLAQTPQSAGASALPSSGPQYLPADGADLDDRVSLSGQAAGPSPAERLSQARAVAKEDPRVVAQVVREWMSADA